jgi:hypothetical protein
VVEAFHVLAVFGGVVLVFYALAQTLEKQGFNLLDQGVGVEIKRVDWLVAAFFARFAFKMETAMVAKHRCQWAVFVAGWAGFGFFREFLAATVAELRAGYDFSRAVGTEIHFCCSLNALWFKFVAVDGGL